MTTPLYPSGKDPDCKSGDAAGSTPTQGLQLSKEAAHEINGILMWLDDDMYDLLGEAYVEKVSDRVDKAKSDLAALLCKLAGHDVQPDQCGIPDHDFCQFCNERPSNHPEWGFVWTPEKRWAKP